MRERGFPEALITSMALFVAQKKFSVGSVSE
jgi:hypothetical protein